MTCKRISPYSKSSYDFSSYTLTNKEYKTMTAHQLGDINKLSLQILLLRVELVFTMNYRNHMANSCL